MSLHLLLDEHIYASLAQTLRDRGVDALTVEEAHRRGESDESHIDWAVGEQRVIVSQDRDYAIIHARGVRHAGILLLRRRYSYGDLLRILLEVSETNSHFEMLNRLDYI